MGGLRTESMKIRSSSNNAGPNLYGRAGFTIKSFCKILVFTLKMYTRSLCARWHNLSLRLDAAALGVSMDIRCTLSGMHLLTQMRFIPGMIVPFFWIFHGRQRQARLHLPLP